ncbi:MAG: Cof-type HAD-IIB family hydrolase [Anaerostipes sp.]|jgi:Cof subfamily protein (haloacid dehalogenase superfamily)|nr:Cof-type HAD-IIB family hydrolase [Anaerostipes sp.]
MNKIVFFDIDGTLFYPGIGIPKTALQAVEQLIENGNKAILCTGRAMGMVPKEYLQLGFHGIIVAAGSHIICEGNELFNDTIPKEYVKRVIEYGKEKHIGTILEGSLAGYYDEEMMEEPYYKHVVEQLFENTTKDNYPMNQDVKQINKWTYHHMNPKYKEEVEHMLDNTVTGVVHSQVNSVEFIQKGKNKATGVQKVLDYFGMGREDSYAFGDSANDIELLQYVQYGIAMGNSVPELLEIAEYKTAPAYEDGIASGLMQFGLI